jgi:serine/threonine protein phosphatase PrpC
LYFAILVKRETCIHLHDSGAAANSIITTMIGPENLPGSKLECGKNLKGCYLHRKCSGSSFSGGVTNVPGRSNEDKFSVFTTTRGESCFGVFDGHNGDLASTLCAKELGPRIFSEIDVLEKAAKVGKVDSEYANFDTFFCEATNKAFKDLDKICHQEGSAGTTAAVLVTKRQLDGSTRVYCANVGDSRCTMARNVKEGWKSFDMSEDHSLKNKKGLKRIEMRLPAKRCHLPCDPTKIIMNRHAVPQRSVFTQTLKKCRKLAK